MKCRICEQNGGKYFQVLEMMFGMREPFTYYECFACGCLQIETYPKNIGCYYRNDYYSYRTIDSGKDLPLVSFMREKWLDYALAGKGLMGGAVSLFYPVPALYKAFRRHSLNRSSRILDVGCGNGRLLRTLHRGGFKDLTGVDPFLERDTTVSTGLRLLKRDFYAVDGKFDCIFFNHSLEHMPEQHKVLEKAESLLSPDGIISISLPISGFAWRTYGPHWVQLDAPRHFFIHTRTSLQLLARKAGLALAEVFYNSDEFQFWGSEQYLRDIPLMDERSLWINKQSTIFSREEMNDFRDRACELNAAYDGDQAVFMLKRA